MHLEVEHYFFITISSLMVIFILFEDKLLSEIKLDEQN